MDSWFSMFHKIIVTGGAIVSSVLPIHSQHTLPPVVHVLPTPGVVSQHTITIDKTVNAM